MKLTSSSAAFATILMLSKSDIVTRVHGHATLISPPSRQWYAHTFGQPQWKVKEGEDIYPRQEHNPFDFLSGGYDYGACGMQRPYIPDRDYTNNYITAYGNPVPWFSQAYYDQGSLIEIEVAITANHQGHFEFGVCTNWQNPTQECFDANQLEFVEDVYYGATPDPSYPNRGYVAPGKVPNKVLNEKGNQIIRHIYKLPDNIYGDKILLQWHWVSQLACRSEGYPDYDWPKSWNIDPWFTQCKVDEKGRLPSAGNNPQQYWQCSEVTIRPTQGTKSGPTTPVNPAPAPSPKASPVYVEDYEEVDSPNGCCTQRGNECVPWCGTSREECMACPKTAKVFWLPNGEPAPDSCTARWDSCFNEMDSCCDGLICVGNQYRARCELPSDLP